MRVLRFFSNTSLNTHSGVPFCIVKITEFEINFGNARHCRSFYICRMPIAGLICQFKYFKKVRSRFGISFKKTALNGTIHEKVPTINWGFYEWGIPDGWVIMLGKQEAVAQINSYLAQ